MPKRKKKKQPEPGYYVVVPWTDPPQLVKAVLHGSVLGCAAGVVAKAAAVVIIGEHYQCVDMLEKLKYEYRNVVLHCPDREVKIARIGT